MATTDTARRTAERNPPVGQPPKVRILKVLQDSVRFRSATRPFFEARPTGQERPSSLTRGRSGPKDRDLKHPVHTPAP